MMRLLGLILLVLLIVGTGCDMDIGVATPTPVARPETPTTRVVSETPPPANAATTGPVGPTTPVSSVICPSLTPSTATASYDGDVTIGVILPLSGPDKAPGEDILNGFTLAVAQANASGGAILENKRYRLVLDSKHDDYAEETAERVGIVQKITAYFVANTNILAVLGPYNSSVADTTVNALNRAGLAQISPSNTYPWLTIRPPAGVDPIWDDTHRFGDKVTYFRIPATDLRQSEAIAYYLYHDLGKRRIYILQEADAYGGPLAREVNRVFKERLGGEVLQTVTVTKTSDLPQVPPDARPDALFYSGTTGNLPARLTDWMSANGLNGIPFVGADGSNEKGFLDDYVNNDANHLNEADGIYATLPTPDVERLAENNCLARQFVAEYKQRFGTRPGAYSASAYDAANVVISAIRNAGKLDREAVRVAMLKIEMTGVLGEIRFNENGDNMKQVVSIYQVRNGQWEYVKER